MSEDAGQAEGQTISDALRSDHRAIGEQLADSQVVAPGDDGATAREQLVMSLVRHFVAEEQYLYPAVRTLVDGGDALAETGFEQARACERELRGLEAQDISEPVITQTIGHVRRRFAEHVRHQDGALFPALEAASNRTELTELGEGVLGAEQLAPTRPRGFVPSAAGFGKLTSLVEGFVDRVRDSYTHRGVDPGESVVDGDVQQPQG